MSRKNILILLVAIVAIAAVVTIVVFTTGNKKSEAGTNQDTVKIEAPELRYGINIDDYKIEDKVIGESQYLGEILHSYGVSYTTIDMIVKKSDSVFNVKHIKAGNPYSVFLSKDTNEALKYFVYEINKTKYFTIDLNDSISLSTGEKDVIKEIVSFSGIIESSLWNSMVDQDGDPNLSLSLADVYAWTIDFYGIQKGDWYKVIYEEESVDGERIGIGRIITAVFHHAEKDYYGYYYVQDSVGDYFDDEANSLKRAFLKAPLKFSRISSRFSNSRLHPILKIRRPHHGVDYAAPTGTPVHAVGAGTVVNKGYSGGAGHMITIRHNSTYTTKYLHLSRYGEGVKQGAHVEQGQIIGYVGSTGLSTGPHLDFRFYKNGQAVDPLKVESPPAKPVDSVNKEDYFKTIKQMKAALDTVNMPS